jgi:ABC-type uncharacterized transport system auxiliary subunit
MVMHRHHEASRFIRPIAAITFLSFISACGRKHYLAQYEFSQRTLAMVFLEPPSPELLTGLYTLYPSNSAIRTAARIGGGVAKEVEARRASVRLDSAVRHVDIPTLLAQRTLERTSRYLGTRPVTSSDEADYILELNMRHFGIDARASTATYLYTRAEAVLIDRKTGREIWSVDVHGYDRLTPWVHGNRDIPSSIITAATTSTVSVGDLEEALDQLVTSSSNAITNELRDKLRDVRDH